MDLYQLVYCPNCGGVWLEGKIKRHKPDLSPQGRLQAFKDAFHDLSEFGIFRAEIKNIKRNLQTFKVDKVWKCTSCGYEFPME